MITNELFEYINNDINTHIDKFANCRWGRIQNDESDKNTAPFKIKDYDDLCSKIVDLSNAEKEYAKTRYFRYKCAMCDEYLFDINDGVEANTDIYDKDWDFSLFGARFDLKSTVIFKDMDAQEAIDNPIKLIGRFYNEQSKGCRNNYQNRIFLVHHSFKGNDRIDYLRCNFDFKKEAIRRFVDACREKEDIHFFSYVADNGKKTYSTVLYIIEDAEGKIFCRF